jgi:stage II sporulation protein R
VARRVSKGFVDAIVLAVIAGVILGLGWAMARAYETRKAYTPTNLIRLHIIGNSDSDADQEVKLRVRDSIVDTFGGYLIHAENAEHAEKILQELLPQIERAASECLAESGMVYDARAKLAIEFYPDRYYEEPSGEPVLLPAGLYKSLQVTLGAGKGDNWWCIMYPPMCFIDIVRRSDGSNEALSSLPGILTGNDRYILVDEESLKEVEPELRFLIIDLLEKGKRALSAIFSSKVSARTSLEPRK